MEEKALSGDKAMFCAPMILNVKDEPDISDYLPSYGACLESSHVFPADVTRSEVRPINIYPREERDFADPIAQNILYIKSEGIGINEEKMIEVSTSENIQKEIFFGEHFLTRREERDFTDPLNAPNIDYIKPEGSGICEENMTESSTSENIQEENSFGQHFLTRFLPSPVKNEYSDGEMADENGSFEQDIKPVIVNQIHHSAFNSSSPAHESQNTNEGNQDIKKDIISMNLIQDLKTSEPQSNTKPTLTCRYCSFQTTIKSSLRQHQINKHHFGMEPIHCPYCRFRSMSLMEVEDHIAKKHHAPKVYHPCPLCPYKNTNLGNVRYHIKSIHRKEKDFFCPYCDYLCIIIHNLKRHIYTVHKKHFEVRHLEKICRINNVQ